MMNETKISRLSLAEEVAGRLKELIGSDKYGVGDKLATEPELMEQFGVGRSSIREAIKILTNDGFVKVRQGTGTTIVSKTGFGEPLSQRLMRAKFDEVNEVRLAIEEKIVEMAVERRSDAHVTKMKQAVLLRRKYAAAQNLAACIQADIDFHIAIAEASANSIMVEIYQSVATHLKNMFLEKFQSTDVFTETQKMHEQLVKAIADKDLQGALKISKNIATHKM
jgi:DNA-binding FadR family transcriptional regulator